MTRSRIQRGRETQELVAKWFREHGWPHCYSTGASVAGRDINGMPGLAPEVKATSRDDVLAALRQATRNGGDDLPFVVWRPNGYGPERVGVWVCSFTLAHGTHLLRTAGYGTPPTFLEGGHHA